jgi:hypothetical protein
LNVDAIFALTSQRSVLLSILPSFGAVNAHFFLEGQLELDLWPDDINSERSFNELLDLVEAIAGAIRAPLSLTIENSRRMRLFTYDPLNNTYRTFHKGPVWLRSLIEESEIRR